MERCDADVVVIGAGPAGCAAAVRLVRAGHRVVVLEKKAGEDGEDITSGELLAPFAQEECAEIGVELRGDWLLDRIEAVRNVYPDGSWTLHRFADGVTYVNLDRGGFNAALRARLAAVGGTLHWGARVTELAFRPDAAVVRIADRGELTARVVIDAGGRYSPALRTLRLKSEDPEFRQIGVAVFFETFADAPLHTWDRHFYGDNGAMISGGRIRHGLYRYILEADLADKQTARLPPVEFYESVARRHDPWLYERIMREPRVGPIWAMAPIGYQVTEVARDRLLLAGDAAGYLAPLTGQGMEFAMRMGRLAAHAVDRALGANDCSLAAFTSYVDGRKAELDAAIAYLRHLLRALRDRAALARAAVDDEYRGGIFGPLPVADRGVLTPARP